MDGSSFRLRWSPAGAIVVALVLAACGSGPVASHESSAATSLVPTSTASSAAPAGCPNPEGGLCLGPLAAGTYTTKRFSPPTTYTVPAGWANYEDTHGNFLLVPPGGSLGGVDAGSSDYIGIYTAVAAAAPNCADGPAPGIGRSAADIAKFFSHLPGLATTQRSVVVGGLKGYVLSIALANGWTTDCPYSGGQPTVQLITGLPPSGLDHGMNPGQAMRLYLLDYGAGTLAIEVTDMSGGKHLAGYVPVVSALKFAGY